MRVLGTTIPFTDKDRQSLDLPEQIGAEMVANPLGRKLIEGGLLEIISDSDVLTAGTERITARVME